MADFTKYKSKSWDEIANWYIGWVGSGGSNYHKNVAIPYLTKAMNLQINDKVLDVGCGNGVLATYLKGVKYFGIDKSENLINYAKTNFYQSGTFKCIDSVNESNMKILPNDFDVAVLMLSIQDINPLDKLISNISNLLKTKAKIYIFMLHPCFRVPRQSGIGLDEGRNLIYRRIDSYLTQNAVPYKTNEKTKKVYTYFYHRPLSSYINILSECNFKINKMHEIPDIYDENKTIKNKKRYIKEIPLFMLLEATR